MKLLLQALTFSVLVACNSGTTPQSGTRAPSGEPTGGTVQTLTVPQVRVKNYNQYNMTLSKLTGISTAKYNALFESIKGSLPADNEIDGLTPFNLIAMTRLADAYCKDFVDREETAGLQGDLNPLVASAVSEFLFGSFLDAEAGDPRFSSLHEEVENVLTNDDGTGQALFPGAGNNLSGNKALTVAACVTIMASPYITLLE